MGVLGDVSRSLRESIAAYDAFGVAMTEYIEALARGDRTLAEACHIRTVAALEAYLDCAAAAYGRLDIAKRS